MYDITDGDPVGYMKSQEGDEVSIEELPVESWEEATERKDKESIKKWPLE